MRKFQKLILFMVFACSRSWPHSEPFTYRCEKKDQTEMLVAFKNDGAHVQVFSAQGVLAQKHVLPFYLSLLDPPREPIQYFYSNSGFEIREQFVRDAKPQQFRLSFVQGGALQKGWKCKYHGAGVQVVTLENDWDSVSGDRLWLLRAVKGVSSLKQLSSESRGMIAQLVERYSGIQKQADPVFFKKLTLAAGEPLLYLSPEMAQDLVQKFSVPGKETWKLMLEILSFDQFAPMQRWIFWAQLAGAPNNEALRIALTQFTQSPLFKDSNMKNFFQKETRNTFQQISSEQMQQIVSAGLDRISKEFAEKLWKERNQ